MEFVAGSVEQTKQKDYRASERSSASKKGIYQGPIRENRQDCILTDVSRLSDNEFDPFQRRKQKVREQPMQKRNHEERRALSGEDVGRADEDQRQPDKEREPVAQKGLHAREPTRGVALDNMLCYRCISGRHTVNL